MHFQMIYDPQVGSNKSWEALETVVNNGVQDTLSSVLIYAEYKNEEISIVMHDLSSTYEDLLPVKHKLRRN